MPLASHGFWYQMMTDPKLSYGTTVRSTSSDGCKISPVEPVIPSWDMIVRFFDQNLKAR